MHFKGLLNVIARNYHVSSRRLMSTLDTIGVDGVSTKRCILYVPANDSRKTNKIFDSKADCVVLDCEDGVALNRKDEARQAIRTMFQSNATIQADTDAKYSIRINSAFSKLAEDDINTIFDRQCSANQLPKCVFIPKTNSADDIKWMYERLFDRLNEVKDYKRLSLFFYMESALSLLNLRSIIDTALDLSRSKYRSLFNLEGFVFGSDDYCADIAATRTKDASELAYARQKLVAVCKAYKLQAIDMVYIAFKDLEGLKQQSEQGFRMGFTGKQVIHPDQVDVTQTAYTPSKEKLEWAMGLIQAFEEHQKSGKGAFTFKGSMIDMPSLLQAKNIINLVNKKK